MKQGTQEWLDARVGRVTASLVGAILGVAPYMTRDDAMRRMVRSAHGAPTEFEGNAATAWGTANEAGARFDFTLETGLDVVECGFYTFEDWAGASPDGLVGDHALIEIKCPFSLRDKATPQFKSAVEQLHYYAQMQFQMMVTGRTMTHFYQWAPHGTKLEMVIYDAAWVQSNVPHLRDFYAEYLTELKNPEHLEPKRKIVETLTARHLLSEYEELSLSIELAESRRKDIMAELEAMAGGRDALICGRKFTKVEKAGAVAYAKVVKDMLPDVDLTPYRGKASSYWKLS